MHDMVKTGKAIKPAGSVGDGGERGRERRERLVEYGEERERGARDRGG